MVPCLEVGQGDLGRDEEGLAARFADLEVLVGFGVELGEGEKRN